MGKRGFGRVSTNLLVDFYWGGELREGAVTNLSANGMFIKSEICLDSGSDIEVVLIVGDEVFKISGKVKRTIGTNGTSGGIGVELLAPSINYRKFICIVRDYANNWPTIQTSKRVREKVRSQLQVHIVP